MKRTDIDWTKARERLRASELALEQSWTPNPQRVREAYRQRAVKLAHVEKRPESNSPGLSALVFRLGQERYAIETKDLAEVLPFERCAPVPGGSRQFLGVINLRGEIRAVLNLRNLVAPSEGRNVEPGFVLMLRRPGKEIGLKIDSIEGIQEIVQADVKPLSQGSLSQGLVSGMLVLLSVDAVLQAAFSKEESHTA